MPRPRNRRARLSALTAPEGTPPLGRFVHLACGRGSLAHRNGEMKAQVLGARDAIGRTGRWVPIQCSVTLDPGGRMLLGTDIAGALATLEAMRVDVIGLNCSTGPDLMRDAIRYLAQNASTPIHCIPNAGLPLNVDGEAVYPLLPEPFAAASIGQVHRAWLDGQPLAVKIQYPGIDRSIDLLERVGQRHVGVRHGLGEGVEVDDDELERGDRGGDDRVHPHPAHRRRAQDRRKVAVRRARAVPVHRHRVRPVRASALEAGRGRGASGHLQDRSWPVTVAGLRV